MKQLFVRPERCLACLACELACSEAQTRTNAPGSSNRPRLQVQPAGEGAWPAVCGHCQDPPCLKACTSGAMHFTPEGGVASDWEQCVGCWMCVTVCPLGAVFPFPGKRKAWKCDLCSGRGEPACAHACPTGALIYAEGPFAV
ncbi:4Fe-4S ferredoxin-type, iron-sulphur binding domain [Moorella glycerini]|uniref:Anaerobic dimethyl sulfoxide reductase chain B n=1 Tax=Neomoorella stamsii TaxID=1266720 RepID=A0A9X7J4V8_9FIRM|nr:MULTISPECIES: 4Fe-4S dicluster domain-containing protein [Moorella]PRR74337.1 Anaerobic dimethyl sulfoxide reductase chain B [Moorella stamsii]CEP66744.1 4Fe-4S ferredoxin-type, iron-sulphur binding domain [Moorella glycerini]